MGFVSDIIGGFTANNAANQANAGAQQDTSAMNQQFGQESGIINNIAQQYYGQGGGASALSGLQNYLQGGLGSTYSSPYTSAASGAANNLSAGGGNAYMTQAGGAASQLQGFNGLKPQELAALQQSTAASGQSTINSARSQMGGGANSNALISNLLGQNNQNTMAQGVQLGGQAAGQELSAQEAAGQLFSGLSGQNIGAQEAGMQGNTALSGQNLDYMSQMIQGLLGTTGQQSGLLSTGIGGLNHMADTYGSMATGLANRGQQDENQAMGDWGSAANGIAGLFTGGFSGGGGQPNTTANWGQVLGSQGLDYGG